MVKLIIYMLSLMIFAFLNVKFANEIDKSKLYINANFRLLYKIINVMSMITIVIIIVAFFHSVYVFFNDEFLSNAK